MEMNSKLSTEDIINCLKNKQFYKVCVEEIVDSTNEVLKRREPNEENEGLVVIANHQTKGKGRLNRSFYSPSDTGIYMSILLRPKFDISKSLFITCIAAVAVCEAIEDILHLKPEIKWVNDVYLDGRKVCGILTEGRAAVNCNMFDYSILGIGVNLTKPDGGFPKDIGGIAGSLLGDDSNTNEYKSRLIAKILDNFYYYYENMDEKIIREEYRKRSLVIGKEIYILSGNHREEAYAVDIDKDMSLIVENDKGRKILQYGEISIRTKG